MRIAAGLIIASTVSVCVVSAAWLQTAPPRPKVAEHTPAAPVLATAPVALDAPPSAKATSVSDPAPRSASAPKKACANPDALGISRVVAVDTTGGPGFGFEHFRQLDFLKDKEVVLTFDDGPWPGNTPTC
jgi:hypothetical protein